MEWGVQWMTRDGIAQCIPPAFAQFMGELLLADLSDRAA